MVRNTRTNLQGPCTSLVLDITRDFSHAKNICLASGQDLHCLLKMFY